LINDTTNIERNLMQEAIFASTAKIEQILTYSWDENSLDSTNMFSAANVLTVNSGDFDFNRTGTKDFRIGHIEQSLHRRMTSNIANRNASTTFGIDAGDLGADDIDDFNGGVDLDLIAATSAQGYKKAYRITTNISYLDDTANYGASTINFTFDVGALKGAGDSSNIKMIEVSTDQNNTDGWSIQPILVLRAFSANIGETDFYKRTY
jgi:hypothetical protein